MRIGELADQAGVSTKTIRYYESIGILPTPLRAENGYRTYGEVDLERLVFIGDAQASGLALDEIRHVSELKAKGQATCGHVRAIVESRLGAIDTRIASLETTRAELRRVLERAEAVATEDCTDPARCQTIAPRESRKRPVAMARFSSAS